MEAALLCRQLLPALLRVPELEQLSVPARLLLERLRTALAAHAAAAPAETPARTLAAVAGAQPQLVQEAVSALLAVALRHDLLPPRWPFVEPLPA